MDLTNINDPAGISSLLESLRASQAWADLQASQSVKDIEEQHPETTKDVIESPEATSEISEKMEDTPDNQKRDPSTPSVAGLLSQLSASSSLTRATPYHSTDYATISNQSTNTFSSNDSYSSDVASGSRPPSRLPEQNLRTLPFQQSLSVVAQLADEPSFVNKILELRKEQDALEQKLWDEREDIVAGQTEKIKIAVTKANMVGGGISEREATIMREGFVKQLDKFNTDRVLPAWDAMVYKQQAKLEALGVPTMYKTDSGADRHRQQRIIQVLEGFTSSQDTENSFLR